MRALLRAIATILRSWLDTVRRRSATEQLETQVENDHAEARAQKAATTTDSGEVQATTTVGEEQLAASATGSDETETNIAVVASSQDVPGGNVPGLHVGAEPSQGITDRREEDAGPANEPGEERAVVDAPVAAEVTPLKGGDSGEPDGELVSSCATTGKALDSDNEIEGEGGDELTSGRGQDVDAAEESYAQAAQPDGEPGDMQADDESDLQVTASQDHPHNDGDAGPNGSERVGDVTAKPAPELENEREKDRTSCVAIEPEALSDSDADLGASDGVADERDFSTAEPDVAPAAEGEDDETGHQAVEPQGISDGTDAAGADIPEAPDAAEAELHDVPEYEQGDDQAGEQAVDPESARIGEAGVAQVESEAPTIASDASEVARPVPAAPTRNQKKRRRSPQYRAPAGAPSPPRQPPQAATSANDAEASSSRVRPASIEVRVLFERGGHCNVALLPKRPPGLPEELTVSNDAGETELVALQDKWYQDVVPNDLAHLLHRGLVWTDEATGREWLLSGREVFVLAPGTAHRGFVSCPRVVLGREHVVLCTTAQLPAVAAALRETGCAEWTQFGEDDGAPVGWRVLRGVTPQRPAPLSDGADILNVLRPLPQIEIALEGGIRLVYNTWLVGHPPAIRVYGDAEHTETVLIDGQEAVASSEGRYTAPGWDEAGSHQLWCSNTSRGYSLVRCDTSWRFWPAYSFSFPGSQREDRRIAFCGPLVRPLSDSGVESEQREAILIPPSNPIILGQQPGQVFMAHQRHDIRGAQCVVSPPFDPVWALPAQPLRCDKRTNRILLVGHPVAPASNATAPRQEQDGRAVQQWYRLILDSSRKGLAIEPASQVASQLWRQYKRYARYLWKRPR